jgi:hypothetical protein
MNDDETQENFIDDISPDYIQRPEDPYPMLQSAHMINTKSDCSNDIPMTIDEQDESVVTDEMGLYLKSMSPYKHQAYLMEDVLQTICQKFLLAQQQAEQRFITFLTEQKRDEQMREERIHREQRQQQLEIVQLILGQGRQQWTIRSVFHISPRLPRFFSSRFLHRHLIRFN